MHEHDCISVQQCLFTMIVLIVETLRIKIDMNEYVLSLCVQMVSPQTIIMNEQSCHAPIQICNLTSMSVATHAQCL